MPVRSPTVLLMVVGVSAFVGAVTAAAANERVCADLPEGKMLFGTHPPDPIDGVTLDACRSICQKDATCVGYNYASMFSSCHTFTQIDEYSYPSEYWVAGRCGAQLPQVVGDFYGNDLNNTWSPSANQCSYTCEATAGCYAYSWSGYNGGTCWMKRERPVAAVAPFDGSVISGEVLKCSIAHDNDFVGVDLSNVPRADWRECCGVCRRTRGCAATSWSNYNGGTCWLKKSYGGYKLDGVPGVIAMELR